MDLDSAIQQIENIYREVTGEDPPPLISSEAWVPKVIAYRGKEKDEFVLCIDLPGVAREDLDLQIHGNKLLISGTRYEPEIEGEMEACEPKIGKFQRVITLPINEPSMQVALEYGVLTIRIGPQKRAITPAS